MITIRRASDRGQASFHWLDSQHTFSFGSYYDPEHMGFRHLRVINEDRVVPGGGVPPHPHRDMEILTYGVDGALAHQDSMGNGSVIRRGDIQRLSAGTGITHSEYNHSDTEGVHFLQIWIEPEAENLCPDYDQVRYADNAKPNALQVIAAPGGGDGALAINQDVLLYRGELETEGTIKWRPGSDRHAWLQVVRGSLTVDDTELSSGDGAAISKIDQLLIHSKSGAEFLLFDLN